MSQIIYTFKEVINSGATPSAFKQLGLVPIGSSQKKDGAFFLEVKIVGSITRGGSGNDGMAGIKLYGGYMLDGGNLRDAGGGSTAKIIISSNSDFDAQLLLHSGDVKIEVKGPANFDITWEAHTSIMSSMPN